MLFGDFTEALIAVFGCRIRNPSVFVTSVDTFSGHRCAVLLNSLITVGIGKMSIIFAPMLTFVGIARPPKPHSASVTAVNQTALPTACFHPLSFIAANCYK